MNINFNDLPCDIKSKIFKINKDEEEIQNNKLKYNTCMNELNMIIEELPFYFDLSDYVDEETDEIDQDNICYYIIGYQLEIRYGCIKSTVF